VSYDPVPSTEEGGDGRFGINVGLTTGVDLQVGTGDRHSPAADASKKAPIGMQGTKTFDRDAAAKYARYWSGADAAAPDGVHVVYQDRYNGTFSRAKQGNNCTNFASQAMNAGGWPIVDGVDPDNMDNWTYDLWGPRGPSKTWSMAYKLWMYASDSKRGTRLKDGSPAKADIWNLEPGDLLFADWDPQKKPDGKIDHAMVISGSYTSLGFTEPTYSQNSGHRQNLPLSIGIKIATAKDPTPNTEGPMSGQNRKVHFYPVHIKDKFETG
jgi:hypothetical protein